LNVVDVLHRFGLRLGNGDGRVKRLGLGRRRERRVEGLG
jgi:hypothetical protein